MNKDIEMCDYVLMDDNSSNLGSSESNTNTSAVGSQSGASGVQMSSGGQPSTLTDNNAQAGVVNTGSNFTATANTMPGASDTLNTDVQQSVDSTGQGMNPLSGFNETQSGTDPQQTSKTPGLQSDSTMSSTNTQPLSVESELSTSAQSGSAPQTTNSLSNNNDSIGQDTAGEPTDTSGENSSTFPTMPSSYGPGSATSPQQGQQPENQQPTQSVAKKPDDKASGPITTQGKAGASSMFKFYVIIAIIIILAIWGYVAYLYFGDNKTNLKIPTDSIRNIVDRNNQTDATDSLPTPTATAKPTLSYTTENVSINAGNVVAVDANGEEKVIVDKNDFTGTGIAGFSRVVASPTGSKICFQSLPPSPEPALYYADIDGSGVTEVNPNRKSCTWVNQNEIAYVNIAKEGTPTDIYVYDLTSGVESNLTAEFSSDTNVRTYKIVNVSTDGKTLSCDYSETETETGGTSVGKCEIDLTTNTVTHTEGV